MSKSFEENLDELEALVAKMSAGELSLAESLAAFKRGNELVTLTQAELDKAEQALKIIDPNTPSA
ncbi:MAG: exodeoxyribonuclease small subunit [Pseudomonadota bacterium]|jgi:exodeoxyribonuclease VII small subunit